MPSAIGDLRGDVRDAVLLLSFSMPTRNRDGSEISDLSGFRILKRCGGCGTGFEAWKDVRLTDTRGYTVHNGRLFTYDNDLRPGFDYGYRVFPQTSKGFLGDGSNIFSIKWSEPPEAPTGVIVREEDSHLILAWTPVKGMSYNVYRWEGDTYPIAPRNTSSLSAPEFIDSGLRNGKEYKYEVRAVRTENGVAYEGDGAFARGTPRDKTAPMPPVGLKLDKKGLEVQAAWTGNNEPDVAGYNIYRMDGGNAVRRNKSLLKQTEFTDKVSTKDVYTSYYVTAVDTSGNESEPSQEMTVILRK